MPSVSPKQRKLMAAIDHGWHMPGGGGPSKAVAHEFHEADKKVAHQKRVARQLRQRAPG